MPKKRQKTTSSERQAVGEKHKLRAGGCSWRCLSACVSSHSLQKRWSLFRKIWVYQSRPSVCGSLARCCCLLRHEGKHRFVSLIALLVCQRSFHV